MALEVFEVVDEAPHGLRVGIAGVGAVVVALKTADYAFDGWIGQRLAGFPAMFLRGLGVAAGESDSAGDVEHPVIYLARIDGRRASAAPARAPARRADVRPDRREDEAGMGMQIVEQSAAT